MNFIELTQKKFGKDATKKLEQIGKMLENLPKVKRGDPAGANAFLSEALIPNTQIFNVITDSGLTEMFNNGDSYLNRLEAIFSLLGEGSVSELLSSASIMELLLKGTGERKYQIKNLVS